MSFSRVVAFVSEDRRQAVTRLLAERASVQREALHFAATSDELARSVTSESLVLVEGSRLGELVAFGRGARLSDGGGAEERRPAFGAPVDAWLPRLPRRTRTALEDALRAPRAWSVKRIAHTAAVSTRQLVRQCRCVGCVVTPKDLLLAARIVAAQAVLQRNPAATSAALARACGWIDARSLRAALARADLSSVAALAELCGGTATLGDVIRRLARPCA